ncbi:uncharacterized protein LOC121987908 [Zingiber officinale]|uniref:uncharacterized protein LOC121987908 n=1 Tax=Zingiber officinale TaxID=94328 RepID=UPI001C4B14DB|nr:uncharacterized protein LOC121987908 [Zingiber officinale]
MKAVTGTVVSSKPISLSKAAAVLSRFAANENDARPEVAAFVRRASAAFDELVLFHREVRAALRRPEERGEEGEWKKKKRKRSRDEDKAEAGDDVGRNPYLMNGNADLGSDGENKKKKRRRADADDRTELVLETPKNLVGNVRHYEDAAKLVDGRNKKKLKVGTEKMSNLNRIGESEPEFQEESLRNRKKKDKKHKRDPKEVSLEVAVKKPK